MMTCIRLALTAILLSLPVPAAAQDSPLPLDKVETWAYQIQGLSRDGAVEALASSPYDMLVIEPTRTDVSEQDFDTAETVSTLKESRAGDGEHRKLVIAYIDIGQAEDWRWYWTWSAHWKQNRPRPKDWPSYILTPDPDGWGGNWVVAYWHPEWKDLLLHGKDHPATEDRDYVSILDQVVRDGFDGVYLDWVEAFENESVIREAAKRGLDPVKEMIRLVDEIREYGRKRNPDFLVIQQNAAALADHPEAFEVIDGIAQEEVFFGGIATDDWDEPKGYDTPISRELTREYIAHLKKYKAAGKPVFNCEYALERAREAYLKSLALGFVPYCSRRSLSNLSTTPPF